MLAQQSQELEAIRRKSPVRPIDRIEDDDAVREDDDPRVAIEPQRDSPGTQTPVPEGHPGAIVPAIDLHDEQWRPCRPPAPAR